MKLLPSFLLLFCVLLFPDITRAAYDPTVGVWLSRDPLPNAEMKVGPNLYQYVYNNPLQYIDSLGLDPLDDAVNPANLAAEAEAMAVIEGEGTTVSDIIANEATSMNEGQQAAIDVAKDMQGTAADKANFLKNLLTKLAKKFNKKDFQCKEVDTPGGGKGLVGKTGGPTGTGGTPTIYIQPNGNVLVGPSGSFGPLGP